MKYTRQGVSLEYDDLGNGTPLLFIHGYPLDRSLWGPQINDLQKVCRVIAPDLRGFGQSSDTDGQAVTMETYAEDMKALLDSLNVRQAIVCGLSMGGYVALAFIEKYADHAKGLILSNTKSGADTEAGRQGRLDAAIKVEQSGSTNIVVDAMEPKMLGPNAKSETATFVRNMMSRQRSPAVTSALRGMATRPDRTPLLASIQAPTLIVTGSADVVIPPSESEALHQAIAHSTLVNIPDAGHLANLDKPDAYNEALQAFVNQLA
jgi:pimeloyl-ACP methyl ester carboxylesterase